MYNVFNNTDLINKNNDSNKNDNNTDLIIINKNNDNNVANKNNNNIDNDNNDDDTYINSNNTYISKLININKSLSLEINKLYENIHDKKSSDQ